MAKNKKFKAGHTPNKSKLASKVPKPTRITKPTAPNPHTTQPQHSEPTIPFDPSDRIILLGDGDLSFGRSLVDSLNCEHVIATVYEKEDELKEKYPVAEENARAIEDGGGTVRYGVDAMKMGSVWRELRGKVDRVLFNFPHVGGKSTDVNRQVRYNQELLVAFFKNALQVLAPSTSAMANSASSQPSGMEKTGSIVVTLFEGHPYTLWNVRDLGRHSGLQVEKSFRFQASVYPGYRHARTLGVVRGKDGKESGWRGEERSARSYVFVRKGEGSAVVQGVGKRKRDETTDDEDEGATESENADEDDWSPGDIEHAVHPSRRGNVPKSLK